jgi:hypothetical protein
MAAPDAPPPSPPEGPPAPPRAERSWAPRVKRTIGLAVLLGALVAVGMLLGGDGARGKKGPEHWAFLDAVTPGDLGLVARGTGGTWALEEHAEATGGRALANHEGTQGGPPALLVAASPSARDLRTRTRCKVARITAPRDAADPDHVPAACGVVFRFVDDQNHWIARADLDASTLEVATLTRGKERVLGRRSTERPLASGGWVDLVVEARGDVVRVSIDGVAGPVLVTESPAVHAAFGRIGLWAPSEATVLFDHFTIETLAPTPRALEILPVLGRKTG